MLKSLVIKNYALIRHLEIAFSEGLNIVTGETGAGKSIMLGALGLLKGQRANSKALYDPEKKCVVEALFDLRKYPQLVQKFEELDIDYDALAVFRREIAASGKSRAFVNDTPVNLDTLKNIGGRIMDIHSQHDTLRLGESDFQLKVLDEYAENQDKKEAFSAAFARFTKAEKDWLALQKQHEKAQKEYDFNLHRLNELRELKPETLNQEELEQQLDKIRNVEKIAEALQINSECLGGEEFSAEQSLQTAQTALNTIRNLGDNFENLSKRLESLRIEMQDILMEIESEKESLFINPEEAEQLSDTLDKLYVLQKKHGVNSVKALISVEQELTQSIAEVDNFSEKLEALAQKKEKEAENMQKKGKSLGKTREAAAAPLANALETLLQKVGILNAQVEVRLTTLEMPSETGLETAEIFFSANKGISPQPLAQVASGGEFSRLMLCLKYILAGKTALPTLIFDEIDTGISGEIAIKVGQMMQKMAEKHQLITISHLPQIAAKGKNHFFVYKDNSAEKTASNIRILSEEERLTEIARMIAGENPSPTAYESARELIEGN